MRVPTRGHLPKTTCLSNMHNRLLVQWYNQQAGAQGAFIIDCLYSFNCRQSLDPYLKVTMSQYISWPAIKDVCRARGSIILSESIVFLGTCTSEGSPESAVSRDSKPVCFGQFCQDKENHVFQFSWINNSGADKIIRAHLDWIGRRFVLTACISCSIMSLFHFSTCAYGTFTTTNW